MNRFEKIMFETTALKLQQQIFSVMMVVYCSFYKVGFEFLKRNKMKKKTGLNSSISTFALNVSTQSTIVM